MNVEAGWYPDPLGSGSARWWDGTGWTAHTTTTAPPGWYLDPWQPSSFRWWDGTTWTGHATPASLSTAVVAREPAPTFALAGGLWAILGIALSVVVGQTLAARAADHFWRSPAFWVLAFYLPIYAGIATTCVLIARRYGSGSLTADFGWRARGSDLFTIRPCVEPPTSCATGISTSGRSRSSSSRS